jgi:hypothetical protein
MSGASQKIAILSICLLALAGPSPDATARSTFNAFRGHYKNAFVGKKLECHQKIDPKNLKGKVRKAEWKKCMADPSLYDTQRPPI